MKEQLYLKNRGNILRLLFIYGLKQYTGMTLREIGSVFDIKYTTVSSLVTSVGRQKNRKKFLNAVILA